MNALANLIDDPTFIGKLLPPILVWFGGLLPLVIWGAAKEGRIGEVALRISCLSLCAWLGHLIGYEVGVQFNFSTVITLVLITGTIVIQLIILNPWHRVKVRLSRRQKAGHPSLNLNSKAEKLSGHAVGGTQVGRWVARLMRVPGARLISVSTVCFMLAFAATNHFVKASMVVIVIRGKPDNISRVLVSLESGTKHSLKVSRKCEETTFCVAKHLFDQSNLFQAEYLNDSKQLKTKDFRRSELIAERLSFLTIGEEFTLEFPSASLSPTLAPVAPP